MTLEKQLIEAVERYEENLEEKHINSIYTIIVKMTEIIIRKNYKSLPEITYKDMPHKIATEIIMDKIMSCKSVFAWNKFLHYTCKNVVFEWFAQEKYKDFDELNLHTPKSNDSTKLIEIEDLIFKAVERVKLILQSLDKHHFDNTILKKIVLNQHCDFNDLDFPVWKKRKILLYKHLIDKEIDKARELSFDSIYNT